MSSTEDPFNVLDELQAYLSQFGVGDSLRHIDASTGHGYVPISLVSYSPKGLTPKYGSAKNSPRLVKQSSASSVRLFVDPNNRGDNKGDGENNQREINAVIMDDHVSNAEKTTQFDREFFQNIDSREDEEAATAAAEKEDGEKVDDSCAKITSLSPSIDVVEGGCEDVERLDDAEKTISDATVCSPSVNSVNSDGGEETRKVEAKDSDVGKSVNTSDNGMHSVANADEEVSNLGPYSVEVTNSSDNSRESVRKDFEEDKMGNSSSGHKRSASGSRVRNLHLDAWSNRNQSEEMRENVSVPSEDSNSFGFDVSMDNFLYRTSHETSSPVDKNVDVSNRPKATNSLDSGFSSPDVKKINNVDYGRQRSKRSVNRLDSTFSDLESALAVPELIIDALGDDANTCDESPVSDDDARVTPLDAATLSLRKIKGGGNESGPFSANQNNLSSDEQNRIASSESSTHFPIIYRRSKNDPGDKRYKEVVRELSFVLEKRGGAGRSESMRNDLSRLEVQKRRGEEEAKSLSRSSESINVFGNKSLLLKLENHLKNRNPHSANHKPGGSVEHNEKLEITQEHSSTKDRYKVDRSSETTEKETNSISLHENGSNKHETRRKGRNILDTYGKRVSAKLIYNHTANTAKEYESIAKDLNFVSEKNISIGDSDQETKLAPRQNGVEESFSSIDLHLPSCYDTDLLNSKTTLSSYVDSSFEVDNKQNRNVPPKSTPHSNEYIGHSLSWARSRVDTSANFRGNILTTSQASKSQKDDSDSDMGNFKKKQRSTNTSSSKASRFSLDDTLESNASSGGHLTTIGIEGRGLSRRSKIMYSEPDLTTADFRRTDKTVSEMFIPGSYSNPRQLHNESFHSFRDLSFSSSVMEEGGVYFFDSSSFSSETSTDKQQLIKVNVDSKKLGSVSETGGNTKRMDTDTYFISSGKRPKPSSGVRSPTHSLITSPKPHSVSMTTIVEHSPNTESSSNNHHGSKYNNGPPSWTSVIDHRGERSHQNRHVTVLRAASLRDNSTPPPYTSQQPVANVTRSHTMIDRNYSHSPRPLNNYQTDQNRPLSSGFIDQSTLYVVIPPHQHTTVPDLIVDHQRQNVSTQDSRNQQQQYGSPFHQEIFEGALPSASGDGLHRGEEDKPASFIIDARRMNGEPTVQVDGPNSIAKCNVEHMPDGQYQVTYIPVEVGLFNAQVKWNGKDIPGSPFHPKIVDARKVRVVGGWQHYMDSQERIHLVVGEEKQIPFDTTEAGPGQLRAEVKSPSAFIPVAVDDEQKGKSVVKFVPREEGHHYIHLYWSDHSLVNSPYNGFATSGVADPSKVWLSGRGLKEGVVREEAEFVIDGSQAGPGEPEVQLTGVRAEVNVFTTPLGGGKYRCTYIPVVPGAYLLHISWNGRQLRGSPYKVNVIGASYPNRVVVSGEGKKGGLLGQNLDFRIDTRKAGPGELTALCTGPNKAAYCELSDHHDGTYRLAVRAQEVGQHILQIRYGGEHVNGSPYHFKVSAQPDASKVRVSGPGVEHGILANFQSQFLVETKGAGAGQLTVRIRGPRGAFQVEMYRESHKDRTILCRYYPTVTGLYIINVRWSGVDVPGSPFHINILDTHQELEQVLHEQGFTPNGHHNFSAHNVSNNSNNMVNHSRIAYHSSQQQHNHSHNTSKNSAGYYQWRGDD